MFNVRDRVVEIAGTLKLFGDVTHDDLIATETDLIARGEVCYAEARTSKELDKLLTKYHVQTIGELPQDVLDSLTYDSATEQGQQLPSIR